MLIEIVLVGLVSLASAYIVNNIPAETVLGTRMRRGLAGGGLSGGTIFGVENYTNFVSIYEASFQGLLGFGGYIFLFGNAVLLAVWTSNFVKYRQLIM